MVNQTNSTGEIPSDYLYCERFQDEDYRLENYSATLASIILSVLSCPVIVVMNLLVIVAVKTKRSLQSKYRILLACLAGTDLFVGTVLQPTSIAVEIFALAGGSMTTYCNIDANISKPLLFVSILATIFHLVLISIERFIGLKHALRYSDIVTKARLALAVAFCWFVAGAYALFKVTNLLPLLVLPFLIIFSLLVIIYCHVTVYLVTRRHEKQIKTEQISGEAAANFLAEKKAWKTTSIIIGFLFLSYLPGALFTSLFSNDLPLKTRRIVRPIVFSTFMLNSLYNPIIYCWRSEEIRKAMISLVTKQNQN